MLGSTSAQLLFSVSPDAAPGPRTITVSAPAGSTSQCGDKPCILTVIDGGAVTTLSSAPGISDVGYSATQLTDGRILVAGGGGANAIDATHTAILIPPFYNWMVTGSLNVGRHSHAAVLLADGRVLVAGGIKSNGTPTATVEIYDPTTGVWTLAPPMPNSTGVVSSLLLTSGKIGVWGTNTYDEYDPTTGTFTASATADTVPDPRRIAQNLAGTLLLDGRVFVRTNTSPFCGSLMCPAPKFSAAIYSPTLLSGSLTNGPSVPASAPLDGPGLLLSAGQVLISSVAGKFLYNPGGDYVQPAALGFTPLTLLQDGRVFESGPTPAIYTPPGLNHPAPHISQIVAHTPSSDQEPLTLIISGSDFLPISTVRVGSQVLVSVFLGNMLVAFVPASQRSSFDLAAVSVTNPGPGGGTATASGVSSASPTITRLNPSIGTPGSQILSIVTGTNLAGASAVTFSGTGVTAAIQAGSTDTQVPIAIVIDSSASLGTRSITVTTSAGTASLNSAFVVQTATGVPSTLPQVIPEVEQGDTHTGYVIITPDQNSATPTVTATFGMVFGGSVQSQAGMFPGAMTTDASLFVEEIPGIGRKLGVAIANPRDGICTVTLTLRDRNGLIVGNAVTVSLQPQQQVARFVSELFSSDVIGSGFQGNLRVQSTTSVSLLGLRFSGINFSTLPVAASVTTAGVPTRTLAGTVGGPAAVILPQFALGGHWATQIALVNSNAAAISGRIDVFDQAGNPLAVKLNGSLQTTFAYSIPAGGTFVLGPRDINGQTPF